MTYKLATLGIVLALAVPAQAQDTASGDADAGAKEFNKCKACHMIQSDDGENIVRGGRVGPNLYGLTARNMGAVEDFRYSDLMKAANDADIGWDEATFAAYVQDPTGYMTEVTGESGRSKMSYKVRKQEDALNLWAYLVSVAP